MMKKLSIINLTLIVIFVIIGISYFFIMQSNYNSQKSFPEEKVIPVPGSLFTILTSPENIEYNFETGNHIYSKANFELKPEFQDLYDEIGILASPQNAAVVYPTFTEAAYAKNGFYDYYKGDCDFSCLTVSILNDFSGEYTSSRAAYQTLTLLGYSSINDIDIDQNPSILQNYDKVILLHNEYVTKNEFEAITNHPKVIYLYPNALYAEVVTDYKSNIITLIQGHGYPEDKINNGFDWEFDNTHPFEYDTSCKNWEFYEISNGIMLNCFPEYIIFKDKELLKAIKDF